MIPLLLVILVAFLLTWYATMPQPIQIVCYVLEAVAVLLAVLPIGPRVLPVW